MGELTAAIAGILEHHQTTLDVSDGNARKEYEAYVNLEMDFGSVAMSLENRHATPGGP